MVLNPFFYEYYQTKLAEGKTKKQALKSVQRRLVNIIFGMMKYGEDYINPPVAYLDKDKETSITISEDEPAKLNDNQLTHLLKKQATFKYS